MIFISALRWVPEFARGYVKDLRVRWALEEAGLTYTVRSQTQADRDTAEYRTCQPFGQVPAFEEDGLRLFERGVAADGRTCPRQGGAVAGGGAQFDRAVHSPSRVD